MKLKKGIRKTIHIIFIIFFSLMFIYSLYRIIDWKKNNAENKKINEVLHEYINVDSNEKYNIDFAKLKEKNPDTVAYLRVNNTNIDYVVVRGSDNSYYLTHNFDKNDNRSGWIFMDYNNKLDGTDKNIVIYGHNTVDKSMFGSLRNVLKDDWYKNPDNYIVILVTEEGINKYQVFSTYKVDNEEFYINTNFTSEKEFLSFLRKIKSRSNYNYNVELSETDSILTLSTCSNNGTKRVVLHAKKVVE